MDEDYADDDYADDDEFAGDEYVVGEESPKPAPASVPSRIKGAAKPAAPAPAAYHNLAAALASAKRLQDASVAATHASELAARSLPPNHRWHKVMGTTLRRLRDISLSISFVEHSIRPSGQALSQPSIFDGAPEGLFATRGAASLPELHGSPKKGGMGA